MSNYQYSDNITNSINEQEIKAYLDQDAIIAVEREASKETKKKAQKWCEFIVAHLWWHLHSNQTGDYIGLVLENTAAWTIRDTFIYHCWAKFFMRFPVHQVDYYIRKRDSSDTESDECSLSY